MEEEHRNIIIKHCRILVNDTDISKLLPKLLNAEIFTSKMITKYQDVNIPEDERKYELFSDITRRGPQAFAKLIECLQNIDNDHAKLGNLLEETAFPDKVKNGVKQGAHAFCLPDYQNSESIQQLSSDNPSFDAINLRAEPLIIKVKLAEKLLDFQRDHKMPVYPMRSRHRGILLTINNIEFKNDLHDKRKGAEIDEQNLIELFKRMGFYTKSVRNQTFMDMNKLVNDFTNEKSNPELRKVDCVVVVVMSHGTQGTIENNSMITCYDGKDIPVSSIIDKFSNRNCSALINKPKILMFQICRGSEVSYPVYKTEKRTVQDSRSEVVREMSDLLVAYSTLAGRESHRDIYTGSWYISLICKNFMEHAWNMDVEALLKMVDNDLSKYMSETKGMQTSMYENRGFKLCYLNPGLCEDNGQKCQIGRS